VLEAARAVWHEASAMGLDEVDISSAVKVAEHAMGVRLASD
jgi:hypothetical protein